MMSAVKAMPADKFDFAPSQAIFVPGRRPSSPRCGRLRRRATHVAEANYFFYKHRQRTSAGSGSTGDPEADQQGRRCGRISGLICICPQSDCHAHAGQRVEVIKSPEPGFQTRATLASFGISHCWDHYGQDG